MVVIAMIVGVVVGIVVHSMGLKYSLLMGMWAAFTNLIPIVGVLLNSSSFLAGSVYSRSSSCACLNDNSSSCACPSAFILFPVFMKDTTG